MGVVLYNFHSSKTTRERFHQVAMKTCCTRTRVHVFRSPGRIDVSLSIPEAAQCDTPLPSGKQVCHPVVSATLYIYIRETREREKETEREREERVSTAMQEERTKKVSGRARCRECNGLYLRLSRSPLATTMPSSSESYSEREPL